MNPIHFHFFFAAAGANLVLTPLFIRLAKRYGFVDHPGHRKIHHTPVAKVGGLAIVASMLVSVAFGFLIFGNDLNLGQDRVVRIVLVLTTTLLATLLGFFDDLYDIRPKQKIVYQTLIMGAFVFLGFHFEVLHIPGMKPIDLSVFGVPLTLFWLMAVLNGFNFMDGIDGLAGAVSFLILTGIGAASLILNGPSFIGILLLSVLGALLPFLYYNCRPARVYLGDAGSNALGAFIATSLVAMGATKSTFATLLEPQNHIVAEPFPFQLIVATLLAGYPFLEVGLSTLRRGAKLLFFGRSMELSEQEHIHHQFLKMGMRPGTICLMAVVFQLMLSAAGIMAMLKQNALAIWLLAPLAMFIAYLGPRTGLLDFLGFHQVKTKPHYIIANYFISMQRVKLGLTKSREEILALVNQTCLEFGIRCYHFQIKADQNGLGGMDYQYQDGEFPAGLSLTGETRKHSAPGEYFDYCETPGQPGEAFWIFVSHTSQNELDVEYRVLVSGFMREALERAIILGMGHKTLSLPSVAMLPHHKTSGHHLRKRRDAKLN